MNTSNPDIIHLVNHLSLLGLKHVVVSPGSRNAPLIKAFNQHPEITCYSVVDERCAGFFALGIAQQLQLPVAAICTSGSALLNYGPAVVEAYYQRVPLLIISADRPQEWISQGDGQAINQREVFKNNAKGFFEFKESRGHRDSEWHNIRVTSDAFNLCNNSPQGPVHLNIPLSEPLYELGQVAFPALKPPYNSYSGVSSLNEHDLTEVLEILGDQNKVMLIIGQHTPNAKLFSAALKIADLPQVAVLTESTSNVIGEKFIDQIDNCLSIITEEHLQDYQPNLLITCGGMVVTKRLKQFLRNAKNVQHWHIDQTEVPSDTYQQLTRHYKVDTISFLNSITKVKQNPSSNYNSSWLELKKTAVFRNKKIMAVVPFSDLYCFHAVIQKLPENCLLQLGNSTVVRYHQLFTNKKSVACFSNRGVSGIDGCTSTAIGAAVVCKTPTILISGDISFLYDSNGLWNNNTPENFLAIVINNSGGNIFRIIDGPDAFEETEKYIETKHSLSVQPLAQLHGFRYLSAANRKELDNSLETAFNFKSKTILEIFTPSNLSAETLKDYWKYLKNG